MNKNDSIYNSNFTTKQILAIVLFLESLVITLAIAIPVSQDLSPKTYFGEIDQGGYITYISVLQLLIAAILAIKIFRRVRPSPQSNKSGFFWSIISIGLFFLALDDAIGIHEQMDFWLHDLFKLEETEFTDLIDDFIVGGYLVLFLIYVAFKWQTIKVFQQSFIFFKLGFVLTLAMVVLDIVSNNSLFLSMMTDNEDLIFAIQQWLGAIEDSAKIFAEGMFIVGIYQCWQIAKTFSIKSFHANN